jgi:hypothetical protein
MAEQRPTSAAQSVYPHLKTGTPPVVEQRHAAASAADAMFGHLRPPRPAAPSTRYYDSTVSLAALADQDPWVEYQLGLMGLRRIR